jgi:hypothetical protein
VNRFGPYRLVRPLEPVLGWERYIALHEREDTDHLIYRHPALHEAAERRRLMASIAPLTGLRHPHLIEVSAYSFDEQDRMCLVTPYTGNQEGLVTLADLVARKSGRMEVPEVALCVEHLLEAIAAARGAGLIDGQLDANRVQIDRRGSVRIELYGLPRADRQDPGVCNGSDEVRAVAELAIWLLTGISQDIAPSGVGRLAGRAARAWEPWLETAMDPLQGFDSPDEALACLPTRTGRTEDHAPPEVVVLPAAGSRLAGVLRRFRRAGIADRTASR